MKPIIWSIKDVVDILNNRVSNEFDANFLVSGDRGNGKSTLINKILYRRQDFKPLKHQVYSRDDVMALLANQEKSICFDDEAINSGYKRNFQDKGQQQLIKMVTAYRDNYNIYASAIPNFFSLDKDLRDLIFLHLHVIERGIAVVHTPLQGRLYSLDRWDSKNNAKIEEKWSLKLQKNPNFKIPYHKLTTFRGYLHFNKLTPAQEKLYKQIKKEKRKIAFKAPEEEKKKTFSEMVYNQLIEGKLTRNGLIQACVINEKKYSSVISDLAKRLKDEGILKTPKDYLMDELTGVNLNKPQAQINQLVPDI